MDTTTNQGVTVQVDLAVYSRSALLKVAHRLINSSTVEITGEGQIAVVRLTPKNSSISAEAERARFLDELLDQSLREIVAAETEGVRNLILAHALSRLPLLGPDLDQAEPFDDPQDIFTADERKRL